MSYRYHFDTSPDFESVAYICMRRAAPRAGPATVKVSSEPHCELVPKGVEVFNEQ